MGVSNTGPRLTVCFIIGTRRTILFDYLAKLNMRQTKRSFRVRLAAQLVKDDRHFEVKIDMPWLWLLNCFFRPIQLHTTIPTKVLGCSCKFMGLKDCFVIFDFLSSGI